MGAVVLEGAPNFRDLGGRAITGGGRVRRGMVFRSDSLHRLTGSDLATLERVGLRVVYDLRGDEECERAPSMLPGGVRCERLPIGGTAARTQELADLVVAGRLADVPPDFLERIYEAMVEVAAPTFGTLLRRLAEPAGTPALVHCTAGKDRTGVAAALLLSVLGVADDPVLDDYEQSAADYTDRRLARLRPRLAEAGIDDDRYRAVFGAPRRAMAVLLDTLRARHGSVAGYLRDEAGVGADVIDALRAQLLERHGSSAEPCSSDQE